MSARTVACDGGGGPLGHPRVWLKLAGPQAICPYCSRLYVLKAGATEDAHH
ncbi:MAG: zinc-finger domain-containing protein [Thermohalobaculum sp.]